jgi:hypothetical protein
MGNDKRENDRANNIEQHDNNASNISLSAYHVTKEIDGIGAVEKVDEGGRRFKREGIDKSSDEFIGGVFSGFLSTIMLSDFIEIRYII